MRWGAAIVSAGHGQRFGGPKQLIDVAGRPLVGWSIATLGSMPEIVSLAIATEPEFIEEMQNVAAHYAPRLSVQVVPGGATRQASVRAALAALPERCSGILVHDGARPLVLRRDIRAGMSVVRKGIASLLASPVVDTVKVVDRERGTVLRTLDRSELWAAETPQFATALEMRRVHNDAARHGTRATDDATLLERAGLDVVVVPSTAPNFKVTLPSDRDRAEALLQQQGMGSDEGDEILVVEAFINGAAALAVAREFESRGGRVDAIDRDLPSAAAVRAFVPARALHGFGERFADIAGADAIFTTHHAHDSVRSTPTS